MATITQTKNVGFGYGNKSNYSETTYANHIWFDPTNKQILLNGIEYIPKKLSELVNDSGFLNSITKSMVENVLTGNITSHTHSYLPLSGGSLSGLLGINSTSDTPLWINASSTNSVYLGFKIKGEFKNWLCCNSSGVFCSWSDGKNYPFLHSGNYTTYAATKDHTHSFASITSKPTTLEEYGITDAMYFDNGNSNYLGARFNNIEFASKAASTYIEFLGKSGWYNFATGNLTCYGSYITMNGDSGAKGYKGYFNQSGTSNRASGSHVFMGNGQALGSNAISLGYNAFAGIRNQDTDKGTYPYIAWQWMPTEKIHITINNQDTANGEFYGYEVLGGKMVQYELGGNTYTYENTSTSVRVLVCVKDDADTGLIFGGKSYMPFNATKTLIEGKYILARGESITAVNTVTVGEVNYYVLAIYTWSATVGYDYSTQVKVMCATKVNNSNYSGASSYASGSYSVASGESSVASGIYSVASGADSVASGAYSVASGSYSVASGNASVASGNASVASGYSSVASGNYSVASGAYSVASHDYSVASGNASVASHDFSVVLARNGETMSSYQTIIGRYNAKVAGLFIIGNGSSSARSNALVVDESGNVTAKYFSGYANAIGDEGLKVYAGLSNEINFGGTSSDRIIFFGYRSMDSRPTPTKYVFGANGTAILDGLARRLAYTNISENADINTFINEGVYSSISTSIIKSFVNAPTNRLNGEMRLEVISSSSSTTYIIQKFWSRDSWSGWKLHIRTTSSDGWTDWKEIALTDSSITGNAATASSLTSLTSSDEASATDTWRKVWFSYDNGVTGRPSLSSNFAYQASTNTLKVGNLTNVGNITFSAANKNIGTSSVPVSELWANSLFNSTKLMVGAGTSVMTFDKDGNVAIGKSSVSTYKLDVSGSIYSMSGGITSADGFIKLGSSDSYVLLAGGGTKAVSAFATTSVATASADGLMSSAMFKAQMVKSVGIKQGAEMMKPDGTITITDHRVYITQDKSNINGVYQQASGENDVTIPNATKDYDGSMSYTDKKKLDKMPNTVFGISLDIDDASTVTNSGTFGDYKIGGKDATLSGVDTIQKNNHYITLIAFTITNDELNNKLQNSFVKFGYSSKDNATNQTMRLLQSNFDGGSLFIEYIHTEPQYNVSFDCIWELY